MSTWQAKDLGLGPKDVIRLWRTAGDGKAALRLAVDRGEADETDAAPSAAASLFPGSCPEAAPASAEGPGGVDTHSGPTSSTETTTAVPGNSRSPMIAAWAALPFKQTTLTQRERRLKEHGPPVSARRDKVAAPGQLRIVLNLSACHPCCRVYFDLEAAKEVMPPDHEVGLSFIV